MNFSNFRPNFENNNYSNQNNFNCPPSNFQDCLCKCCTCVCVQCCCECLCECHRQRSNNNCNNNFNFINQKFRRRNIKKLQPSKSQDCYNNFSGMSRVDLDEFNKELTALKNKIMNQKNNFCNERLNYFSNPPLSNNSNDSSNQILYVPKNYKKNNFNCNNNKKSFFLDNNNSFNYNIKNNIKNRKTYLPMSNNNVKTQKEFYQLLHHIQHNNTNPHNSQKEIKYLNKKEEQKKYIPIYKNINNKNNLNYSKSFLSLNDDCLSFDYNCNPQPSPIKKVCCVPCKNPCNDPCNDPCNNPCNNPCNDPCNNPCNNPCNDPCRNSSPYHYDYNCLPPMKSLGHRYNSSSNFFPCNKSSNYNLYNSNIPTRTKTYSLERINKPVKNIPVESTSEPEPIVSDDDIQLKNIKKNLPKKNDENTIEYFNFEIKRTPNDLLTFNNENSTETNNHIKELENEIIRLNNELNNQKRINDDLMNDNYNKNKNYLNEIERLQNELLNSKEEISKLIQKLAGYQREITNMQTQSQSSGINTPLRPSTNKKTFDELELTYPCQFTIYENDNEKYSKYILVNPENGVLSEQNKNAKSNEEIVKNVTTEITKKKSRRIITTSNSSKRLLSKLKIHTDLSLSPDLKMKKDVPLSETLIFTQVLDGKNKTILCYDLEQKFFKLLDFADFGEFLDNLTFDDNNIYLTNRANLFYIVTGTNSDKFYCFDCKKNRVLKYQSLNNNHSKGNLIELDENRFICLSGEFNKKVEIYDLQKNEWNDLPEMLIERAQFGCVIIRDKIFCVFGYNAPTKKYLNSIEFYDLNNLNNVNNSQWEIFNYQINDENISLYIKGLLAINYNNDKIILVGGYNGEKEEFVSNFYQVVLNDNNDGEGYVEEVNRKLKDFDKNKGYIYKTQSREYLDEQNNNCIAVYDTEDKVHLFEINNMTHDIFSLD